MTDEKEQEIDAAALFKQCDAEYYSTDEFYTPDTSVRDVVEEHGKPVTVEIDIGTFTISGYGMGEVEIQSDDRNVIDYYNATKLYPFGENVMQGEIEQTAYEYNQWIITDCINHWIAVSDTFKVVE